MHADLALVGFGNLGRRFARLIAERAARLMADDSLACRIVGISTRRHGATWNAEGVDVARALHAVEHGGTLGDIASAGDVNTAIIDNLSRSRADLRVVIETTTLDIAAGQPRSITCGAGCRVAATW